jgi:hypothetical protein
MGARLPFPAKERHKQGTQTMSSVCTGTPLGSALAWGKPLVLGALLVGSLLGAMLGLSLGMLLGLALEV